MSSALPSGSSCTPQCASPVVVDIPGSPGAPGAPGADGANGKDAYTSTTSSFVMPAELGTVTVAVGATAWMAVLQPLFVTTAGTMQVTAIVDGTHVTLKNLANTASGLYPANAAPAATIAAMAKVTAAGLQGVGGTGSGDMLKANNLSDVLSASSSLTNLGGTTVGKQFLTLGNPSAVAFPRINADNTVTARSAANYKTDLGLVIGTNVQAWDADLDALAALISAADKVPYFTGAGAAALATFTAAARALLAAVDAAAGLVVLDRTKQRQGLLGKLVGVNLNSGATDNAIAISATKYRVTAVVVLNGSISLTTATVGVFVGAGGGGGTLAADQVVSAITGTTKYLALTLSGVALTDILTGANLQFRVGTAQGAAATGDVYIFGEDYT